MHLADAFIQSLIQVILLLLVCVFHGNWTHNLCAANAMFALLTQVYCIILVQYLQYFTFKKVKENQMDIKNPERPL